jgi:hypothetical protein
MPMAVPPRILSLLFIVLLSACAGDRGSNASAGDFSDAPALEGAPSPMDTMLHVTIALAPVGASGILGEAMAMHSEDAVVVILEMQGLREGISHPAHIHAGSCAGGGPIAVALNPVTGLADGTGSSTTALDAVEISPASPYFIQVRAEDGTPVACGDMEGHGNP